MPLPTNSSHAKHKGCSPVSSNCVIWQGPDLDCIGLCKGDTISDVIYKIATELCELMEMFDLDSFDIACLNIQPSEAPSNTGELFQIIIDRVCALEGIDPVNGDDLTSDCPENCVVPIADCFQFVNPQGDTVTTMPLLDYITAIGNQICTNITDIGILQNEVDTLQTQLGDTQGDVINLQNDKADTNSLNYQVNVKTSPTAGTQYITDALRFVENSLISTQDAVGTPTELYQNILKEGLIGDEAKLFGTGNMNSITGWTSDVTTTAESLGNAWLAIQDLRAAVTYMQENCCSTGCTDIFLNFRTSLNVGPSTSILSIFTDGSTGFTNEWKECDNDTRVVITDALGNNTSVRVKLIDLIDNPSGFQVDITGTTIDTTEDITSVAETCFVNTSTDTTCEKDYSDTIRVAAVCPSVVLTVLAFSVNYQFTSTVGFTYIINIYFSGGATVQTSQIVADPGVIVNNTILGLLSETDYDFEVIAVDTVGGETACTKIPFTTLADNCVAPINAVAILTT